MRRCIVILSLTLAASSATPAKPGVAIDVTAVGVVGDALYATVMNWPGNEAVSITSLARGSKDLPAGKIEKVELLGHSGDLSFTQDSDGLKVKFPVEKPCYFTYVLKITGLKLSK